MKIIIFILMLILLTGCKELEEELEEEDIIIEEKSLNDSDIYQNYTKVEEIIVEDIIEEKYFGPNPLYPGLAYNKLEITQEEVARFRKIMSSIPSEYFDYIEYIGLHNKQHPNREYQAYIYCEKIECHINYYELKHQDDEEIYNMLLHELGHKFEYKELRLHYGDEEIFGEEGLSEDYAETWRINNGGDVTRSYSSN